MRRMYSEQELSKIIKEVFDKEVADGEFDETIADYVDAYLVEHPVDITALEGQTIAPANVNATGSISAPSIVETMTGYSASLVEQSAYTIEKVYISAVKNGNKLTVVFALNITKTAEDSGYKDLATIVVPNDVYAKLYPTDVGGSNFLSVKVIDAFAGIVYTPKSVNAGLYKSSGIKLTIGSTSELTLDQKYYFRYEETFLLSDDLIGE